MLDEVRGGGAQDEEFLAQVGFSHPAVGLADDLFVGQAASIGVPGTTRFHKNQVAFAFFADEQDRIVGLNQRHKHLQKECGNAPLYPQPWSNL